jgi:hypothetical protein
VSAGPVCILTSGIGLGVYIPGLLIARQLAEAGVAAEVEVLEGCYRPDSLQRHLVHKAAYRANFALAQMAHRMTRDVGEHLDDARIDALVAHWVAADVRRFVVWSGFWLPVIVRYRARVPGRPVAVDLCRIDAEVSASFKVHRALEAGGESVWLWQLAPPRLAQRIPVGAAPPVPYAQRARRLVVHGGGWGLGGYADTLPALSRAGFALDIVIHDRAERRVFGPQDRCWMVDPDWQPWQRDAAGRHGFPPVGEVPEHGPVVWRHGDGHHPFHDVIRDALAIVSKPGGCTLIDSLAAATPVVLLEAYGYAEQANAQVWSALGFGLDHAAWAADGHPLAPLAAAHARLLAADADAIGYPRRLAAQMAPVLAP